MFIFIVALYVVLLSLSGSVGSRNVGTVLFSKDDLHNRKWSKDTLALLKARMYFQRVVPPFASPRSDVPEYVNGLLRYLRNSYATIRKESPDKETDRILTIAFTDVIGGYLKMFALPIAKYAYYGGTLPKEETLKLFLFYEDAKRYLRNNGSAWAKPDVSLLNSVTINVAYTPFAFIRSKTAADPCVFLSYFEKTPTGLTIPTPRIDWSSCTMFIPLANHSFINLYSAKRATDLHKYYNIATNCVRLKKPSSLDMFTERFQSWLQGDVMPHLNDDHLYPALQGILSLINNTGSIAPFSVLNNVMNEINNDVELLGLDLRCTSKKMAIIIIIVLLELAWCIPTLLFVLYRNVKKDRSSKDTTRTSLIFRSHSGSTGQHGSDGMVFTPRWHVKKKRGGLSLKQNPFAMMEVGEVYSSLSVMSVVTQTKEPQTACSIDVATMVDEALAAKKRKQMKDSETQPEARAKSSLGLLKKDASNETWTRQQSSDDTGKTVTLSSHVPSKNTKIQIRRANEKGQDNSTRNFVEDMGTFCAPRPPSSMTDITNSIKTAPALKTETPKFEDSTSLRFKLSTPGFVGTPAPCSDDKILKPKRMSRARCSRHTDEDSSKYKTGDKPYLEIRIDRPKQGISVGISRKEEKKESPKVEPKSFNKLDSKAGLKSVIKTDTRADLKTELAADDAEVSNKADNADNNKTDTLIAGKKVNSKPDAKVQKTDCKVSRIPKRSTSPHTIPCGVTRQKAVGTTPRFNVVKDGAKYKKSMIPKLKRAKDDSALKREKSNKSVKLNVTL